MAQKNNIRSIRFSDELAELIDRQAGDTFTQKFEGLITRCVWELPEKEKQLADIRKQIDRERERLYNLQKATEELRRLEQDIQSAQRCFAIVERRAKAIAEAAEQDVTQTAAPAPSAASSACVTKGKGGKPGAGRRVSKEES